MKPLLAFVASLLWMQTMAQEGFGDLQQFTPRFDDPKKLHVSDLDANGYGDIVFYGRAFGGAEWATQWLLQTGPEFGSKKLKSTDFGDDYGGDRADGSNASGFSGLPGSSREHDGTFNRIGTIGQWWSSTRFRNDYAWTCSVWYTDDIIHRMTETGRIAESRSVA